MSSMCSVLQKSSGLRIPVLATQVKSLKSFLSRKNPHLVQREMGWKQEKPGPTPYQDDAYLLMVCWPTWVNFFKVKNFCKLNINFYIGVFSEVYTFGIRFTAHTGEKDGSIKKLRVCLEGIGLDHFSQAYSTKFKLQLETTLTAMDDQDSKLKFTSGR